MGDVTRAAQSIAELVATRASERGDLAGQPRKTVVRLLSESAQLGIDVGATGAIAREGTMEDRAEWWLDHTNLAALYQWLCDNGELDPSDVTNVRYFLGKPWKWDREYRAMHGVAVEDGAAAEVG